jgi:hypothetical protein
MISKTRPALQQCGLCASPGTRIRSKDTPHFKSRPSSLLFSLLYFRLPSLYTMSTQPSVVCDLGRYELIDIVPPNDNKKGHRPPLPIGTKKGKNRCHMSIRFQTTSRTHYRTISSTRSYYTSRRTNNSIQDSGGTGPSLSFSVRPRYPQIVRDDHDQRWKAGAAGLWTYAGCQANA